MLFLLSQMLVSKFSSVLSSKHQRDGECCWNTDGTAQNHLQAAKELLSRDDFVLAAYMAAPFTCFDFSWVEIPWTVH